MDLIYGYKNQQGTGISDEILASSNFEMISITIDTATRDAGNSPTTDLRRGLILTYDGGTGKYVELDAAPESASAVILAENVPSIDAGDVVSKAYYKGSFKTGKLIDASVTFDPTLCPRISIRDNE